MSPSRRWTVLATVGLTVVVALCAPAAPASAEGSGGATSRVVGRGDIVTTLLGWQRPTRTGGGASTPCRWITFDYAQTEFLVAMAAAESVRPGLGPLIDLLGSISDPDTLAHADLQGWYCDGTTLAFQLVPRAPGADVATNLARRMITRLPPPEIVVSPPPAAAVPVSQPVFISVPAHAWQPITAELSDGAIVAEVRATPVGLRAFPGVPDAEAVTCEGPGRPFDPASTASVDAQSRAPGACTVRHGLATHAAGGHQLPGRPDAWIGTVTVLWNAEWRVAPGPWRSLGTIPRTRLVERSVAELSTSIEVAAPPA
jgi:hypothetical protein